MPNQTVLTKKTTFGAAGTNTNIFSGERLADLPSNFGSRFLVTYCSNCDADGFEETVYAGNRAQPVHASHVGVSPNADYITSRDDVVCQFEAAAGEKIVVSVTAPGANDHIARLIVTPLS